jgi:sugar phosphate isomerase/epimerase
MDFLPGGKVMLPIVLQLYNVREDMAADFEGSLQKVAALGYQYVELAGLYGRTAAQFKAGLEKAGLKAVSAHVPYRDMLAAPENVIGDYKTLGCRFIVIPYLAEEDRSTGPNYEKVKEGIVKLCEEAQRQGLVMLYHNHDFEFVQYRGKYALDDLYDTIPASLLQTEIDTCWVKVAGVDPAAYVRKYAGRSPVVHLKDFYMPAGLKPENMYELIGLAKKADPAAQGGFEFRAVGAGVQDIPGIIKAAGEAGAQWLVVEQDRPTPGKTPLECAGDSLAYLKSL